MSEKEKYILMYKDEEVLSFSVCFNDEIDTEIIEKLEHFDKAPYEFNVKDRDLNLSLKRFITSRTISSNRCDYKDIMEATHSRNGLELALKGHGLSLSNHYWYKKENENLKYKDINFFQNKWDDSFARAVIKGDYKALETADINVPDVVTGGWGVKGWLCEDKPKLYKIGIHKENAEESLGEVLASSLAKRLFNKGEVLDYQLGEIYGKYASVSSSMIGIDEELVPLSQVLPLELYEIYRFIHRDHQLMKKFYQRLLEYGYKDLYQYFIKIFCLRNLCFVSDLHFDNLSMIRNIKTQEMRPAPVFDLGGAFGSSNTGKKFITDANKGSLMIIYFLFGNYEIDWDYSWYDGKKLEGFEEEIREILGKGSFYTEDIIDTIIGVYQFQKASLEEVIEKSKKQKTL